MQIQKEENEAVQKNAMNSCTFIKHSLSVMKLLMDVDECLFLIHEGAEMLFVL